MRHRQTGDGAEGGEDEALDEHLTHLPRPFSAQRRPHRNLLRAANAPRQQQVGDVGRREQEQQQCRGHQRQGRAGTVADERFAHRRHREADAAIGDRPNRFGSHRHRVEVGLRLLRRHTRRQPGEDRERDFTGRIDDLRHPRLHVVREPEAGGHHADDGHHVVFNPHRPADCVEAPAELALPQRVAEHENAGVDAEPLFVRRGQTAGLRPGPEQVERACGHQRDADGHRHAAVDERPLDAAHADHRRETACLVSDGEVIGHAIRPPELLPVRPGRVVLQTVDARLVRDGQRPQQRGVDHVEDGAAGRNPDGQGAHEGEREAPVLPDEAECEPQVDQETGEAHAAVDVFRHWLAASLQHSARPS